ncbi:hypothetical protein [Vitiosangium sp. GDMCC 1.1324]|uniref:hypothetical protein n=1 Tax=Vitiosangium sp. (strain GDMCC 1.1324) TaxID=2138576 RepID=UPI000D3BE1B3|nr:hypothetical protein [Vitiosangium sp. GDMCC 1.1324]PTL78310.1 hypothetical protein DAT35_40380 [Vitiosangium sp. GDMCC 1.1324]
MPDHSTIQVRFVDAATGQSIGEAQLPVENLPQSFEAATTLRIGEKSYEVVSASPMTAREFRATGTLRITMREVKIETMDTQKILYSLPTIAEELPAIEEGSTKLGKEVLELHEDDWRQVELVALTLESSIETDLRAIAQIHQKHREGPGFNALHIREAVPAPMEGTWLTLLELRSTLGESASWFEGLAFRGVAGLVAGGFAVKLPSGLTLYGTQKGGRIDVLALQRPASGANLEGDARMLAALASRTQLCLIDWCRVDQFPPTAEHFREWLSGKS